MQALAIERLLVVTSMVRPAPPSALPPRPTLASLQPINENAPPPPSPPAAAAAARSADGGYGGANGIAPHVSGRPVGESYGLVAAAVESGAERRPYQVNPIDVDWLKCGSRTENGLECSVLSPVGDCPFLGCDLHKLGLSLKVISSMLDIRLLAMPVPSGRQGLWFINVEACSSLENGPCGQV